MKRSSKIYVKDLRSNVESMKGERSYHELQGRKDDIWSLIYLLIEMHCGLPWQHERDKERLEIKKMNISDKDLLCHFPGFNDIRIFFVFDS